MITAAALCPAAPLLIRELTGADPVVPELRRACVEAATELRAGAPDIVVVVGAGARTRIWDATSRLDLAVFAPGIGSASQPGDPELPSALGVGAWLLTEAGHHGERVLQSVASAAPADHCADLGASLASSRERVAMLVLADGSARRGLKAPGYLDDRSAAFDAQVESAVRDCDPRALLAIDEVLARDLLATGRAAWQVLAGALQGYQAVSEIRYRDDPFGVAYLVASLRVGQDQA